MTQAIVYIARTNTALKRFTALTKHKIVLLGQLNSINRPCTYSCLYAVLGSIGCTITHKQYVAILKSCIASGYITRSTAGRNVLFTITLNGKALLHSFCAELESIVKQDIAKYGNGLP